jgi:hypothetical protein
MQEKSIKIVAENEIKKLCASGYGNGMHIRVGRNTAVVTSKVKKQIQQKKNKLTHHCMDPCRPPEHCGQSGRLVVSARINSCR